MADLGTAVGSVSVEGNQLVFSSLQTLTVSTSAVSLTVPSGMLSGLITAEDAAVRFRLDGTSPTSAVGHVLNAGDILHLDSAHQLANAKFIRKDGTDGKLQISYGS